MTLARLAVRYPRLVLFLLALVAAVAAVGAARLRQTDNLLDFIPPGDEDVKAFREVNRTFGALRVALVGVEARPGEDVFASDTLRRLDETTKALKSVRGVDRVVSLSSLVDFTPSNEMVQITPLIDGFPATDAARKALREKVMSRDHVVGNFVARDGTAALFLVYLADGAPDRPVAVAIRSAVEATIGDLHAVYGGAPFAGAAIYDETQADLRRLSPIAVILILGVILLAFREPVGVALSILTVAWSVLLVIGAMGFMGEPFTAASGTLPVVLFASGSSYAVHLLGRYYGLSAPRGTAPRSDLSPDDRDQPAILRAAAIVGPPVAVAGFTTAAGFISFLVMDIRPMRAFGLECAVGVILCLIATLMMVPATLTLWPRPNSAPAPTGRVGEALARLGAWGRRRRRLVLVVGAGVALATVGPMLRVEVRMEPRTFFRKGSDPWRAERFLEERFGGSQFLQVAVGGDLTDPATLQEIKRLEMFARSLPNVSQVSAIVEPLMLVNGAMSGSQRLPETAQQAKNLLFFVEGEPSIKNLLATTRDQALVHIRIRGDREPVIAAIEGYLEKGFDRRPAGATPKKVEEQLGWLATVSGTKLSGTVAPLALPAPSDPRMVAARRELTLATLLGEGGLLPPVADVAARERVADLVAGRPAEGKVNGGATPSVDRVVDPPANAGLRTVATVATVEKTADPAAPPADPKREFIALAPSPEEGEMAWTALQERLHDRGRTLAVDAALSSLLPSTAPLKLATAARDLLSDLLPLQPTPAAPRALTTRTAGEPILERGLSHSVGKNQERSLAVSIVAVLILMGLLFRSVYLAIISVIPSGLAMAALFGTMGLLGVRIDIGTSLVASIATGAGSDFAMHYLWYLRRASPDEVVRFVGPIMVISTLLIAAGFAVLGAGQSQPMRMFGTLAALSMVLAALFTFLLVPALLRKVDLPRS